MKMCLRVAVALTSAFVLGCGSDVEVEVPAASVTVAGPSSVAVGETISLTATTADGTDAAYAWSSSDDGVATVEAGVVTAVAPGAVIIAAVGEETGARGIHGVVVPGAEPVDPPEAVVVVAGEHSLSIGETAMLTAVTVNGEDGSYGWASSDDGIATVDEDGNVAAVAPGTAEITATGADTGKVGAHGVVVLPEPGVDPTPSVSVEGPFLLQMGETVTFSAFTLNGEDTGYGWTTSAEDVATIDDNGTLTAHGPGEVVVTATGAETGAVGKQGVVVAESQVDPPFWDEWVNSPHADKTAEAFVHWDEDGAVPPNCARCHSEGGFLDYIGADGSAPGTVEEPAAIGTVVSCATCHNAATLELDTVTFPSGDVVTDLGAEARCMQCHQGRSSTTQVDEKIAAAGVGDDEVSDALSFQNIHYLAAGATLYGGLARGGYQYAGETYDSRNRHVDGKNTCLECHNQHSLEVRVDQCVTCHSEGATVEGLADVRMFGSTGDYDGDGDTAEGIKHELEGLADKLLAATQAYAVEQGSPIVYDGHAYPYFFNDTDGDGEAGPGEANFGNKYAAWTPRLLRAAYNYQYFRKDPGAYAHNPKYVIQLLHDSVADLDQAMAAPTGDVGDRSDAGHFNGSTQAWRRWDEDGTVPKSCSKCHSGEGFLFFHEHGVTADVPVGNGLACATCHETVGEWTSVRQVASATLPSNVTLTEEDVSDVNDLLCITCHSGRTSKASVDQAIADDQLSFKNIHYLAAAATLFGSDGGVGYQYDGKTYAPKFQHTGGNSCTKCHAPKATKHTFSVKDNADSCALCHGNTDYESYRMTKTADYDGDADTSETLAAELEGLAVRLYAQMQTAAAANGTLIAYDGHAYPYFFVDTDGDGLAGPSEANYGNRFKAWTPALLKASFNYQQAQKETGAWAHNFSYAAQLLYDSIEDLGGDTTDLVRP